VGSFSKRNLAEDDAEIVAEIVAERDVARSFLDLLQCEQAALAAGDVAQVGALAQKKSGMVTRLGELAECRRDYLLSLGFTPDHHGMEALLNTHPQAANIWHELLGLARIAQQINLTNGAIIDARLNHHRAALAALQSAAGGASIYDASGLTRPRIGGQSLGAA